VLQQIFLAGTPNDILTKVAGQPLGAFAPQDDLAMAIDDVYAEGEGFENQTI
jgi:hypothetical protein